MNLDINNKFQRHLKSGMMILLGISISLAFFVFLKGGNLIPQIGNFY